MLQSEVRHKMKRPPSEAASETSTPPSVVAGRRSVQVPWTMAIGLTNAALNGPIGRTTVPGSKSAAVIVIAVVVAVIPIGGRWDRAAGRDCAGDAQCRSNCRYGSHDAFLHLVFSNFDNTFATLNAA